jgi:hypothetical protein
MALLSQMSHKLNVIHSLFIDNSLIDCDNSKETRNIMIFTNKTSKERMDYFKGRDRMEEDVSFGRACLEGLLLAATLIVLVVAITLICTCTCLRRYIAICSLQIECYDCAKDYWHLILKRFNEEQKYRKENKLHKHR